MGKVMRFPVMLACAVLAVVTISPVARAADQPVRLADVLTIDDATATPGQVRDRQAFTITVRLTNFGHDEITGLQWFLSILPDPSMPRDHPDIEVLDRSPNKLDLPAGAQASISLTFRVTDPGTRYYGLQIESDDPKRGVVFAADPVPRTTLPNSTGFLIQRYTMVGAPVAALVGALIVAFRRSAHLRQIIRMHLFPPVGHRDAIHLSVSAAILLVAFNLSWLAAQLSASGLVSPSALGWMFYLLIPARWIIPLIVAIYLAHTRVPALHIVVLFLATYIGGHVYLWEQVSLELLVRMLVPGLILAIFCMGLRGLHIVRPAPLVVLGALTGYSVAAIPWFRVYVDQVLMF